MDISVDTAFPSALLSDKRKPSSNAIAITAATKMIVQMTQQLPNTKLE
jgi:hypothetical protein